jgi:hypothetical protein
MLARVTEPVLNGDPWTGGTAEAVRRARKSGPA